MSKFKFKIDDRVLFLYGNKKLPGRIVARFPMRDGNSGYVFETESYPLEYHIAFNENLVSAEDPVGVKDLGN